jgi:hypothetical protein
MLTMGVANSPTGVKGFDELPVRRFIGTLTNPAHLLQITPLAGSGHEQRARDA